jgi:hypothetical protein
MAANLKNINKNISSISELLAWKMESIQGANLLKISGLVNVRKAIKKLEQLNLFPTQITALRSSIIFTSNDDLMQVALNEGQNINRRLETIKSLTEEFHGLLVAVLPHEDPSSINIKLPPIDDFDQLSKVSKEIHTALTQVIYNDEIKGQSKITSVDNGSIWINVLVGATAVKVVASLVWSAVVIYKKYEEAKMFEEHAKSIKVKREALEELLRAQKEEIDLMLKAEAEFVQSEHFKDNEQENIERIKFSIKTFSELILRGAEIKPALNATEDISSSFPDPQNLLSTESKIKKLMEGKGE